MHNSVGKLAGLEVAASLDDLFPRYPDGMTITDLQRETGFPYHTAHAAVIWLVGANKAQWIQRPDSQAAVLVPLDWEAPAWGLTDKQSRVLGAIAKAKDDKGESHISYRTIAAESSVSVGSITAHIDALDRKGYLEIVFVGGPSQIGCYKAYPEGNGPKGYSDRPIRTCLQKISRHTSK